MLEQDFYLKPSRYYLFCMVSLVLASLFIIVCLPANIFLRSGLFIIVMAYGAYIINAAQSIKRLRRQVSGAWYVSTTKTECLAELLGSSTVTQKIAILRFRLAEGREVRSCIVLPDSLRKGDYRKLLVLLKQ